MTIITPANAPNQYNLLAFVSKKRSAVYIFKGNCSDVDVFIQIENGIESEILQVQFCFPFKNELYNINSNSNKGFSGK